MRKKISVGLGIAALFLVLTTYTVLAADTITILSTTADLSYTNDYGGVAAGNTLRIDLNLPFDLDGINSTGGTDYLNITADATTTSTTVTIEVNGVVAANSVVIPGGTTQSWTLADFDTAGVLMNRTYLKINITANANATTATVLTLSANDASLVDDYTTNTTETLLVTPAVDAEAYAVKDNVTITQNSDVNITDVNATLSYPSYALSSDVPSYYNFGKLNKSETKYTEISYQKQAPYVSSGTYTESASTGKITTKLKIYSYENLTATFAFNPQSKDYSKWFPNYDGSVSGIKLNDKSVSYKASSTSISISTLSLVAGYNTLEITYTPSTQATYAAPIMVVTPEQPWYYQTDPLFNVQYWFWVVVGVCLVIIVAVGVGRK